MDIFSEEAVSFFFFIAPVNIVDDGLYNRYDDLKLSKISGG